MAKLRWSCSYKTLLFDTPDGDLHKGQFAVHKGHHLVRVHPENNDQWTDLEGLDRPVDLKVVLDGLVEVKVVDGQEASYDEFILPNNRLLRIRTDLADYHALGVKDAPAKEKSLSNAEIADVQKDDNNWKTSSGAFDSRQVIAEHHSIALDGTSDSGAKSSVTSITWSHTVTSSSLNAVVIGYGGRDTSATDILVSSMTYNGNTLGGGINQLQSTDTNFNADIRFILNQATGAHNAVINLGGTVTACAGVAWSVSGAKQSAQPDTTDSNNTDVTTDITDTITIVAANSWAFNVGYSRSGTVTNNSAQTQSANIAVNGADDVVFAGYWGPLSAGDHVIAWTESNDGNDWTLAALALSEDTGAAAVVHTLASMGVGK